MTAREKGLAGNKINAKRLDPGGERFALEGVVQVRCGGAAWGLLMLAVPVLAFLAAVAVGLI